MSVSYQHPVAPQTQNSGLPTTRIYKSCSSCISCFLKFACKCSIFQRKIWQHFFCVFCHSLVNAETLVEFYLVKLTICLSVSSVGAHTYCLLLNTSPDLFYPMLSIFQFYFLRFDFDHYFL